jgi:hypothetical protein
VQEIKVMKKQNTVQVNSRCDTEESVKKAEGPSENQDVKTYCKETL